MTVEELRQALADLPVVMSKDSEGNRFSPLAEAQPDAHYQADSDWSGEVVHPDDFDEYPDAIPAVCLWPTN